MGGGYAAFYPESMKEELRSQVPDLNKDIKESIADRLCRYFF